MPVLVETVSRPSAQDHTDLGKVYADAPDWLLAPYASVDALLAGGRGKHFNLAHILAAKAFGCHCYGKGIARYKLCVQHSRGVVFGVYAL